MHAATAVGELLGLALGRCSTKYVVCGTPMSSSSTDTFPPTLRLGLVLGVTLGLVLGLEPPSPDTSFGADVASFAVAVAVVALPTRGSVEIACST